MLFSSFVAFAMLGIRPVAVSADTVSKIEVTISTGDDDLRSDSGAMIMLIYSNGHRQVKPIKGPSESFGGNSSKTISITPNDSNLRIQDIYQIRVDFSSGKATGFDDHWRLRGVAVNATVGSNNVLLYSNQKLEMLLQYSQHWMSPFFSKAEVPDMINPSEMFATIEGAAGPPVGSKLKIDLETDDGRAWHGETSATNVSDTRYPGARVESIVTDKISVQSIRVLRIGYSNGPNWDMRGVRFQYKDSTGEVKEFASFNEVKVAFFGGGWWQSPILRRLKRPAGEPISYMQVEVLTGGDDLRRLELPQDQSDHYNSKTDITVGTPYLSGPRYPNWLVNGDYVRNSVNRTQPMILQDHDEFPDGWTGSFGSFGRFTKIFRAIGTPFFVSSDLQNVVVKFHQGKGGNFLPTQSSGGGIIGALRQPDQWDLQGVIVSVQGPTGPLHRIYSNFAINQRMNKEGQAWKSPNFETLLLRRI